MQIVVIVMPGVVLDLFACSQSRCLGVVGCEHHARL